MAFVSSIWQFPNREIGLSEIFRWYGTTPLALAERVLSLTGAGLVVDVCSGTGTFGEAAIRLGRTCLLVDINPVASLIARCRLRLASGLLPDWPEIKSLIETFGAIPGSQRVFDSEYSSKWFESDNLQQIRDFLRHAREIEDPLTSEVALVIGLSLARSIAEVNLACTHHLVRKTKGRQDVRMKLRRRLHEIEKCIASIDVCTTDAEWSVKTASASSIGAEKGIADAVIIHPPYLGVVNYFNVHRLSIDLYLDALDQSPKDAGSIKLQDVSDDNEERYASKSRSMFDEAIRVCAPGGTVVLIQGDHRFKGRLRHPNTEQTMYIESQGLHLHERFIWLLEHNAGMHVERKGHHIDHNYVSFFRRSE